MESNKPEDILVQVTCKFSIDNHRNGYFDLINDGKLENFHHQLLFNEDDSSYKIFHDTVEDLNLARLYLNGYDVTIVKYGRKSIFYESGEEPATDKTDESESSAEDSDDSENDAEFDGGIVQKFIRTIFEEIVSAKELSCVFSVGWTEIKDQNQLLDLLNGKGLVQCVSMNQLMDTLQVGLSNRNINNNHNILSIVLEQQWVHSASGLPQHKLSTVNFCDLNYGTDRATLNNFISDPTDLPMNFYSQPQLPPYAYMMPSSNGNYFSPPPALPEFGFFNANHMRPNFDPTIAMAQQQSNKLLKNAEILFSKLNLNEMNEAQRKEIHEWMYLKTECDNFMPGVAPELPPSYFGNMNAYMNPPPQQPVLEPVQQSSLLPIIEMDETNDPDEDETNDNESECGSYIDINDQSNILFKKMNDKMTHFRDKTDELVRHKNNEYFQNNPKVLSSGQSERRRPVDYQDEAAGGFDLGMSTNTSMSEQQYLEKSGRRRSIRDNSVLNSDELNAIRKAAASSLDHELVKENQENDHMAKLEDMQKDLKKCEASIDATNFQIKEVEQTISLRANLIATLIKNSKTRLTAKSKCQKKKNKYLASYDKATKQLKEAIHNGKRPKEIKRLEDLVANYEQKLLDLHNINKIAAESSDKQLKQVDQEMEQSKRQLEGLKQVLKKEVRLKESIKSDLSSHVKMMVENGNYDNNDLFKKLVAASPSPSSATGSKISDGKNKTLVNARISQLDNILKEKSKNLEQIGVKGSPGEDKEKLLRYEIRNLRRTRDTLLDQVALYKKSMRGKRPTDLEERNRMKCDEAILAIDDLIEVKNELICGHKSIDTDEKLQREKGEQLLMARLNKMSDEEMRIMLYRYFMKVIDMKESCNSLEQNLMMLKREKEAWQWREKILRDSIRQVRLENERNLVIQQKNHETRMNLLLRHFASDTANSSMSESNFDTNLPSGAVALPDYEELNIVNANSQHQYHRQQARLHHQEDNDREFKKKLFTKFQVLARYHQQGPSSSAVRVTDKEAIMIPHENLKQLKDKQPATKVTRQKNKLIIQQNDKH